MSDDLVFVGVKVNRFPVRCWRVRHKDGSRLSRFRWRPPPGDAVDASHPLDAAVQQGRRSRGNHDASRLINDMDVSSCPL